MMTATIYSLFIVKMPQIPLNSNGKPDITKFPIVMKEGNV